MNASIVTLGLRDNEYRLEWSEKLQNRMAREFHAIPKCLRTERILVSTFDGLDGYLRPLVNGVTARIDAAVGAFQQ